MNKSCYTNFCLFHKQFCNVAPDGNKIIIFFISSYAMTCAKR